MRAFLAVHSDSSLRAGIEAVQKRLRLVLHEAPSARVSWVRPDTIHLTVKFLGDTTENAAARLREGLMSALRGFEEIIVPIDRLGAFPSPRAPRTLWVGPSENWEAGMDARRLTAIVRCIDGVCSSIGIPTETRPWHPHVTVARVRSGERDLGRALAQASAFDAPIEAGVLRVASFALVRSELLPAGPRHTTIWTAPSA